ncbi:MAG: glycosyltransferase [Deltaproteobacteria bacterium]|nr:glycosyltransferase [Deltaproteobacteria bacterium]
MKILFVGSTRGTACSLHYFTSLVRLGHSVLPFDPEYFVARNPIERLMIRSRKAPTPAKVVQVGQSLMRLARENTFDIVFVMAENFLGYQTIEEIRRISRRPPLFLYHSHDNNFSEGICKPKNFEETIRSYDFMFTTKSQNVRRYQELGQTQSHFIPSAYEPTVHHPIIEPYSQFSGEPFEVTFVGTYDKSRDEILDAVGWERLHIWGNGWKHSPNYPAHRERITPSAIYFYEFADVISHSQCALGLLRAEAADLHTQRTFEIPACGALQIAPRTEEILSFFDEDKQIVCYGSLEELRDKTEYFLNHSVQRRKIAQQGHERCVLGKHTYVDRVSQMLAIANEKKLAVAL